MRSYKSMSLVLLAACGISGLAWWLQGSVASIPENWPLAAVTRSLAMVFVAVVLSWIFSAINHGLQNNTGLGALLRRWLGIQTDKRALEADWLLWSLNIVIWVTLPLLVLREWGLTETSRELFTRLATTGIPLGEGHLVPSKVLLGIVMFAFLVTLTRWLKNRLHSNVLSRTQMHPGTREAVATMFGYVAFILALLAGLTFAGFDLTNLAIMAGALGVGIGFGLQNIVNNFISGIILLFERPIRPGDFITVGTTEGFVRNVSIRSTEIETLARMSVIVPNSDMLTNHLQNWTLRDPFGRITIPVGVAYGSDTEKVKSLLLESIKGHPDVIEAGHAFVPGPNVIFKGFGDSSLDFELRIFIRRIEKRWLIQSDINFEIDKAFRENGITIPFPQRDLWLRNPPPEKDEAGE